VIPVDGLARSIADLELALSVAAGPHIRDPRAVPAPLDGPHPEIPVRVALVADPGGAGVRPEAAEAVQLAAASLDDAFQRPSPSM